MTDEHDNAYPGPVHNRTTRRSGLSYFFYDKHHRGGPSNDAQWLQPPLLTHDDEFAVFDSADEHRLNDERDNLYGLRNRDADGRVPTLGTREEQLAFFPYTRPPSAWHGYPIWPLETRADDSRLRPPPIGVLLRMIEVGLINEKEKRRLRGGKHI